MSGDQINFQSVFTKADRARMELERELDDLNERLEEQGGATQAQVSKIKNIYIAKFVYNPFPTEKLFHSKNIISINNATFKVLLNIRPTLVRILSTT